MPDTRSSRGPHPRDAGAFTHDHLPALRQAVGELSWLLTRGYAGRSAVKLVGDRHSLTTRQRMALQRCAAGDSAVVHRQRHRVARGALRGERVEIDGYNVLLTVEAALSGGLILLGRDGVYRDLAAMSSHYKRVHATRPALELIGRQLAEAGVAHARWVLDRPISNSGRLAGLITDVAEGEALPWSVDLVASPDRLLRHSEAIVATADSAILDRCERWFNLARTAIDRSIGDAWIVDLSAENTAR